MTSQIIFEIKQENAAIPNTSDAMVHCISMNQAKPLPRFHFHLDKEIDLLVSKQLFSGKKNKVHMLPTYGLMPYAYVILIGIDELSGVGVLREAGACAVKAAEKHKLETLSVHASSLLSLFGDVQADRVIQVMTEGFLLGNYKMKSYEQSKIEEIPTLQKVTYTLEANQENLPDIEQTIKIVQAYAQGTNYARDLTNLPGNYLIPGTLADEAVRLSNEYGFTCEISDEEDILRLGMGGLYEVGKGSIHPPRMIVMKYQGLDQWTDVLGLVGKGITFDTGGISLKKSEGMQEMISDMGGAAAVMGVMRAVGEVRPKANLVAVIPAAENMPSGKAYKPGDIVTTMSGRTIEVLNTDAEGRIVLAEGLTYAKQLGAEKLIDISTLTGAILVALGDVTTGAVTNDESFLQDLMEAAEQTGERVWQLPAYPEYWDMIKSSVADVKNSAGRQAGSITAALFVGTFAEETPWIHLDIGGTAWLWDERGLDSKGGTGVMVRTLLHMVCHEKGK